MDVDDDEENRVRFRLSEVVVSSCKEISPSSPLSLLVLN